MKHISVLSKVLGYYVLYIVLANVAILGILLLLSLFGIKNVPDITGEFLTDLLIIPILILLFKLYKSERTQILFESKLEWKKVLKLIPFSIAARIAVVLVMGILAAILLLFLNQDIATVIDEAVEFQWSTFDNSTGWEKLLGFFSFALLGPINEELLNRAVILDYLRKHYSTTVSIIYSSVIFMLAHLHPGLYLSSFILGLALAWVYVKWKNIWYAIILHILINMQPFILSYFIDRI